MPALQPISLPTSTNVHHSAVNQLAASGGVIWAVGFSFIHRSDDGGSTWQPNPWLETQNETEALHLHSVFADGDVVVVGGKHVVLVSTDGGKSFTREPLTKRTAYDVLVANGTLYAFCDTGVVARSFRKAKWSTVVDGKKTKHHACVAPWVSELGVHVCTRKGSILTLNGALVTSEAANVFTYFSAKAAVANQDHVLLVGASGLQRSVDGGSTFTPLHTGVELAGVGLTPGEVWLATTAGGVYRAGVGVDRFERCAVVPEGENICGLWGVDDAVFVASFTAMTSSFWRLTL